MVDAVQLGYAESMQVVFYIMAGVLAVTYIVGHIWMVGGKPKTARPEEAAASDDEPIEAPAAPAA
jgi:hypothetical protein